MNNELVELRNAFGVTQERFAGMMGVPLRTYEDLEAGRSRIREVHVRAAYYAVMQFAADGHNPDALPENLQLLARNLVENLNQH